MKKIFGIIGVVMILFVTFLVAPSLANGIDQDSEILDLKILLVIGGTLKVCTDEKELYGFGLIVYNDGETNFLESYSIYYKGFPLIHKSLLIAFCVYIPADV